MKKLSEEQVDDILKLKFGRIVEETGHRAYVSNRTLGKIFQMSEHRIAGLIRVRFAQQSYKKLPLMQKLR